MKADSKTEAEVMAALEKMSQAYGQRDINALLATLTPDPDVFLFGTGMDEKRVGQAEIKMQAERDWVQTEAASFDLGHSLVSAAGGVAWAAVDVTFNVKAGGQEMSMPARLTAVLEKRSDTWLIAQSHLSVPMAGQEEGESWTA